MSNFLAPVGRIRPRGGELEIDLAGDVRRSATIPAPMPRREPAFPTPDVLNVPRHAGTMQPFAGPSVSGRTLDLSAAAPMSGRARLHWTAATCVWRDTSRPRRAPLTPVSDRLTARVEIDNILDRTDTQSSYSTLWIYPGTPRSNTGSLTMRF
ncbi:hypothetical protein [uncultured Sphingomonas sp.]|uniref:hypothetical protein n=1 Tax=uncultured Sphingomonas sp. TaxID=158754 RepID=UPI0025DA2F4D|nr:hypothetical protein [uncultured Sphingomonas sp.]